MSNRCRQELCEFWSGDGRVCPCALFGIDEHGDPDDHVVTSPYGGSTDDDD